MTLCLSVSLSLSLAVHFGGPLVNRRIEQVLERHNVRLNRPEQPVVTHAPGPAPRRKPPPGRPVSLFFSLCLSVCTSLSISLSIRRSSTDEDFPELELHAPLSTLLPLRI